MEEEHELKEHTQLNNNFPVESACSNRIALTDMSEKLGHRDVLYLFACHLE